LIAWALYEKLAHGKPTAVGAASGAIAGLVAITPSCAFLMPIWALVLGLVVGLVCGLAVNWKFFLGYDDSLDVVGIHLVGGIIGTLYIGLLGQVGTTPVGLLFTGDVTQLGKQAIGVLVVGLYAFIVSYCLGWLIQKTIGFRVKSVDEIAGLDVVIHGESAYSQADPRWSRNP
jgi:Amt family ammonium transporter